MAAATILQSQERQNCKVLLFEKNKILGAKVRISGWGRCNLTTNITSTKELLTKYPRWSEFIESALRSFTPKSIYKWFENNWLELKIEADDRVFPKSNNANDVVKVFEDIYKKYPDRIDIYSSSPISKITKLDNWKFEIHIQNNQSEKSSEKSTNLLTNIVDKIIITTWGIAHRQTWSTGDGYAFAEKFGHKITKLGASLNSFLLAEKDIYTWLQWLSYKSKISFLNPEDWKQKSLIGNIVWTHFGISGPAIFALASHLAHQEVKPAWPVGRSDNPSTIYISYLDKNLEERKTQIEQYIFQNPKKQVRTMLTSIVPERLSDTILQIIGIDWLKPCWQLSKNHKIYICKLFAEGIPVNILERRPWDEFVTAGGVDTSEVNEKTMESLLCPWLYFAGEILDVDGYTGGFNLTACWASGRLAGLSV